jgi:sulfate transport system ATP-binding protein
VLLLDEPFGALDAQVRKELRDWLRKLHDEVNVTTLFVTHDQEEALEVSDELVVINNGRIEQIGSPTSLYDHPANDFVMGFLGPVTRLDGQLIRPHDIEVLRVPSADTIPAKITRLLRVGFEVRAELQTDNSEPWVQLTRGQADDLDLVPEGTVWLRTNHKATTLAAS